MGNILLFIQHTDGKLSKASLSALSAARELKQRWEKDKIIGLTLGPNSKAAAAESLSYGLSEVLFSEAAELKRYLATPYAFAIKAACENSSSDTVVAAATSVGKDCIPRVAALLKAGQASDIVAVNEDSSLRRPVYAGDLLADVEINTALKVVTVRATGFAAASLGEAQGSVKELEVNYPAANWGEFVSFDGSPSDRPELGDAEVVVSGGRALKSAENFMQVLAPLASVLGAAIGASRAAVDSGYAPNDWQVGQTGKVVAPSLYIAAGISGAIQHLAGMKDSKVIVSINTDPEAPIFEISDYALVADLFKAVPELVEELKKIKSS